MALEVCLLRFVLLVRRIHNFGSEVFHVSFQLSLVGFCEASAGLVLPPCLLVWPVLLDIYFHGFPATLEARTS